MPEARVSALRRKYWTDRDNIRTVVQDEDETIDHVLDFSGRLEDGETVSSATVEVDGITLDNSTLATPKLTLTVSGTGGTVKVEATTSNSRVLVERIRFRNEKFTERGYA